MGSLEELARKKFPDPPLSAAEERVVRNAPNGSVADCTDLGGGDEPAKADGSPEAPGEKWPPARNVRAGLIRWLFVDREARELVDPRGVWIGGARITGRLDLSFTNVLLPLILWSCRLEEDIDLEWAKMPVLGLDGSWTGPIDADGLKLEGSLLLRNGFHAEGGVRLPSATIGGNLDARGGTFKNLGGDALSADHMKVSGDVFLGGGFRAEGAVRLPDATIGGSLNAEGGTFKNPNGNALNGGRIKVTGGVFLRNGFSAEGEVRLLGATIGGNLDAGGGTFKNPNKVALNADGIKVGGDIFLSDKFVADGTVRLNGSEIKGQLDVEDAWLDALILQSAHIAGPFFWRKIRKDSHPDFPNKEWKPYLDLTIAKVGSLIDQETSWPEKGRLILDGFGYDGIGGNAPIDAKRRLKWLGLQPDEIGFRPQPYEQLIAVLRRLGHEHQVAEVAIAKQKDLREHGDPGWLGWIQSGVLYHVVGYGYRPWRAFGWMAMLVLFGTLVFSVARLPAVGVMVPSDKEAYESDQKTEKTPLPRYYPKFNALVYSLDIILQGDIGKMLSNGLAANLPLDLGQKSHWRLSEKQSGTLVYWIFEVYSLFQLFIGWVLLLVAAAVPAGFIKKD